MKFLLFEQFSAIRSFQLDIQRRPTENSYFPVFHTTFGADNRSVCEDIAQCLWLLKEWSHESPSHAPVFVWINAIDIPGDVSDDFREGWSGALDMQLDEVLCPEFNTLSIE